MRRRSPRGGTRWHTCRGKIARLEILADQRVPLAVVERADLRELNAVVAHLHDCPGAAPMAEAARSRSRWRPHSARSLDTSPAACEGPADRSNKGRPARRIRTCPSILVAHPRRHPWCSRSIDDLVTGFDPSNCLARSRPRPTSMAFAKGRQRLGRANAPRRCPAVSDFAPAALSFLLVSRIPSSSSRRAI